MADTGNDELPTRQRISDAVGALGWRLVRGALHAEVRVPSLAEAATLAVAVVAAVDDGQDRLGIDVRADRAVLRVRSPRGVSEDDLRLAHAISAVVTAAGREVTVGTVAIQAIEIAIDALDIGSIRPFWKAVLGYVDDTGASDLAAGLVDPVGRGPVVWFQQMDAPRPQRNRIHLDIDVPHDEAAARLGAALAAGGTLLSAERAPAFWVLADAEGNEACVCTWQGRD